MGLYDEFRFRPASWLPHSELPLEELERVRNIRREDMEYTNENGYSVRVVLDPTLCMVQDMFYRIVNRNAGNPLRLHTCHCTMCVGIRSSINQIVAITDRDNRIHSFFTSLAVRIIDNRDFIAKALVERFQESFLSNSHIFEAFGVKADDPCFAV